MTPEPTPRTDRCQGKKIYTKREAETAMNARERGRTSAIGKRRKRRKRDVPDSLRIYHCHLCNGWHLTHKEFSS